MITDLPEPRLRPLTATCPLTEYITKFNSTDGDPHSQAGMTSAFPMPEALVVQFIWELLESSLAVPPSTTRHFALWRSR
jgi:hypothetical protein